MQQRYDFFALHDVVINGIAGYRSGDGMTAEVVENLREQGHPMEVGVDVRPARPDSIPRPAESAAVTEWRAYAIGQGMAPDEAAEATRADLIERYPDTDADRTDFMPLPPAKSAPKADWVTWYVRTHPDVTREDAEAMTVRQLQGEEEAEPG